MRVSHVTLASRPGVTLTLPQNSRAARRWLSALLFRNSDQLALSANKRLRTTERYCSDRTERNWQRRGESGVQEAPPPGKERADEDRCRATYSYSARRAFVRTRQEQPGRCHLLKEGE